MKTLVFIGKFLAGFGLKNWGFPQNAAVFLALTRALCLEIHAQCVSAWNNVFAHCFAPTWQARDGSP